MGKATAACKKDHMKLCWLLLTVLTWRPQQEMGNLSAATIFGPEGGAADWFGMVEAEVTFNRINVHIYFYHHFLETANETNPYNIVREELS